MISRSAFETILKEYDEKQLNAARMQQQKRAWIEEKVPRLKEIENRIAALSVNKAIARIAGDSSIDASEEIRSLKEEKKAALAAAGFSMQIWKLSMNATNAMIPAMSDQKCAAA